MDAETAGSFLFMFIGLGFFLGVMQNVTRDHREAQDRAERAERVQYERKLAEAREFGYENSGLRKQNSPDTPDK